MIIVDLHVHSTFSDGTLSPEALAGHGKEKGLSVMSLTDHDTVAGVSRFLRACSGRRIRGVAGIELSADYHLPLHILGYRIEAGLVHMEEALAEVRKGREWRNEEMCRNLRGMGLEISMKEVALEACGEIVARPHMAKVLVRKGYAPDIPSAFARFLGNSSPAYVERYRLSPAECIRLIGRAGGLAVLAHPGQVTEDFGELESTVAAMKDLGLWGMECLSSRNTPEQVFRYMSLAAEYGLYPTAGSDFHGCNRPSVHLGVPVPEDLLPWARLGISL